jgi:hypothetical protein
MADPSRSILDQLEDALLKIAPAAGGVIGALMMAGALGKTIPVFLAFVLGGAVGGGVVYLGFKLLFRLINPGRDRSFD